MSQENVERVREAIGTFNRGDYDAVLDLLHPDVEWQTPDSFPEARTHRGPEGVREFFRTWLDTFRGFRLHLERCDPVDEHRVLGVLRGSGEGAGSGAAVESPPFFQLFEFRDGKLIRARMFQTESEALDAAGIAEQDPQA